MENRNTMFTPPHKYHESYLRNYFEELMHLTYENPILIKDLIYTWGVGSLALLSSPWTLPWLGMTAPLSTPLAVGLGAAGLVSSVAHSFIQQRAYGLPITEEDRNFFKNISHGYDEVEYSYGSAKAHLIFIKNELPKLTIKSDNAYDAGYVEGYILGKAINSNLNDTFFLYPMLRLVEGAPHQNDLQKYLKKIKKTIPHQYIEEMQGKVQGYNDWLTKNAKNEEKLTFEKYLLFQLIPDFYNYNPFHVEGSLRDKLSKLISFDKIMGCTTMAYRLGDYTFLARVLDWAAYGVAGKSFLQVDRQIGEVKRTIDIGLPLLSGAATVVNSDDLLIEINISPSDKVFEPNGMPAFFFNRYCAENAASVKDIENIIKDKQPVAAYHLTATDGIETKSFHFYQNKNFKDKHAVDALGENTQKPQLLSVANNGVIHTNNEGKDNNYCDSNQRKNNIEQFFNHNMNLFTSYIKKQEEGELSKQDILELKKILLDMTRLPLVNNCESVFCALYVYYKDKLIDASAATDNLYAPNQELNNFKQLSFR